METKILLLLISINAFALTPEAEKGKAALSVCLSCHNEELTPALAPPLYGVQSKYKQAFADKELFVQAISDWAKNPSIENSLMKRPVQMFGLMPAMPLPDEMLANIGAYLYEEDFPPPCTHWANNLNNSETQSSGINQGVRQGKGHGKGMGEKGQGGNHEAMIRMKHNQLCK